MPENRRIAQIIKSQPTLEGAGVHLKRVFGFGNTDLFDPFLLLDDFRSDTPAHYLKGFPWHPHRGIETITYMLEGQVEHGDSLGNSGIISAGSTAEVRGYAQRCRAAGFTQVKMKVGGVGDVDRVRRVRDVLGPSVSLRLDANAAFRPETAIRFAESVADCDIDSLEQPIPRGAPAVLARLRRACPIPIVADESVVTMADARALIAADAVDAFNLRVSKCGGILPTIKMADAAREAGVGIQLGCQVGETALLSAAGRHVAAHSPDLRFIEGSYGTHLLVEDVAVEDLTFGPGGRAPGLTGTGLGVTVRRDVLERYADDMIELRGEDG